MLIYKINFEKAALKFLEKQTKPQHLRLYKAIYYNRRWNKGYNH